MPEGLPEALALGAACLDTIDSFTAIGDWMFHAEGRHWSLRCQLTLDEAGPDVPQVTPWYLVASGDYPAGLIRLYPDQARGLQVTFPHQTDNSCLVDGKPWRRGHPCLDTPLGLLGRSLYDAEPTDAAARLAWHVQRALMWLQAAAQGKLTPDGDPYELPPLPAAGHALGELVYNEDAASLAFWSTHPPRVGMVRLANVPDVAGAQFVRAFGPAFQPGWGHVFQDVTDERQGIWLRLDHAPVIAPWQLPLTWGELNTRVRAQGFDLFKLLCSPLEQLRDRQAHLLLLGWPMPAVHGGPLQQMHWQALELPVLSRGNKVPAGWPPDARGRLRKDRSSVLADEEPLKWMESSNWSPEELGSRGRLPGPIRAARIAVLGVGALGSAMAELLARAGTTSLLLVDGDSLAAGNLVRHTLTLQDVNRNKAAQLARRLNLSGPHMQVQAVGRSFWAQDQDLVAAVRACDLIVDCTASDGLLLELQRVAWREDQAFVSLSVGLQAQRLYGFYATGPVFPLEEFLEIVGAAVEGDLARLPASEVPREGIGCWHPVFPARHDDVTLLAAVGVKYIEAALGGALAPLNLQVYEQVEQGGLFSGVRLLEEPLAG